MASVIGDNALDQGLNYIHNNVDKIYICSADPTTYTEATSTFALGNGAATFGAAAAGSPNGRKVTSTAITAGSGSVTSTGTATKWGAVYSGGTVLVANGALSASQSVTSGNTFSLTAFDIRYPNQ